MRHVRAPLRIAVEAIGEAEQLLDSALGRQHLITADRRGQVAVTAARTKPAGLRDVVQRNPKKTVCAEVAAIVVLLEGALQMTGMALPEVALALKVLAEAASVFGCALL